MVADRVVADRFEQADLEDRRKDRRNTLAIVAVILLVGFGLAFLGLMGGADALGTVLRNEQARELGNETVTGRMAPTLMAGGEVYSTTDGSATLNVPDGTTQVIVLFGWAAATSELTATLEVIVEKWSDGEWQQVASEVGHGAAAIILWDEEIVEARLRLAPLADGVYAEQRFSATVIYFG